MVLACPAGFGYVLLRISQAIIQFSNHLHNGGIAFRRVDGRVKTGLFALGLRKETEGELLAVLADDAVGVVVLCPDINPDFGLDVADVYKFGDEFGSDTARSDCGHGETLVSRLEVDIHKGHLASGSLVLPKPDSFKFPLDEIELLPGTVMPDPTGKLALAKIKTGAGVGGRTAACEGIIFP